MQLKPIVEKPVIRAISVKHAILAQNGKQFNSCSQSGWEDFDIKYTSKGATMKMASRMLKIKGKKERGSNESLKEGNCYFGEYMHFNPKSGTWSPGIPKTDYNLKKIKAWLKPDNILEQHGKTIVRGALLQLVDDIKPAELMVDDDDGPLIDAPIKQEIPSGMKAMPQTTTEIAEEKGDPKNEEKTNKTVPEKVVEDDDRKALEAQAKELGVRVHHSQKTETIRKNIEEELELRSKEK